MSKKNRLFKVGVLGLAAGLMTLGAGSAFAGDTTAQERAMLEEFGRIPAQQVEWTAEQYREGAEHARLVDRESYPSNELMAHKPVDWTPEELRMGAEFAERQDSESYPLS